MRRLALVVVSVAALSGCKEPDPAYCDMHPGIQDCPGDPMNGGPCKGSSDCRDTPEFPLCDTTDNTCVQCTAGDHANCTGMTPRCDNRECVACVDDSDCDAGAGVCLPTGGCADPSSIIHATVDGAMSACGGVANPCSLDAALLLAKVGPKVIKLDDAGPYISTMNNFIVDVEASIGLTIDARGATIQHNGTGAIFTINDGKGMTILGGTIEGASGGSGEGIRCGNNATLAAYGTTITMNEGLGINAPGGCTLTLSRSRIASNRDGGVIVTNSKFVIIGNMFLDNGDSTSQNPGVTISTTADTTNRLEFNTIANNSTTTGIVTAGVDCKAGMGFTASHNIIWSNTIGGSVSIAPQIANSCGHVYSDIGPLPGGGTGNFNDPPLLSADGHLGPGSPAIKKAEPGADLTGLASRDIDGNLRVPPADIGADQAPRP